MENKFIVLKEKPKGVRRIFRENGIRTFPGGIFLFILYASSLAESSWIAMQIMAITAAAVWKLAIHILHRMIVVSA